TDRRHHVDRNRPRRGDARDPLKRTQRPGSARHGRRDVGDQGRGRVRHAVTQLDRNREHLLETYRKKAKHYDVTSRLYPVPGYPQQSQRLRSVQALRLRRGATVVDVACGTGLNFSLIEKEIGREGRIVGVDLTDAMLAQAETRVETNGWHNVTLVQAD